MHLHAIVHVLSQSSQYPLDGKYRRRTHLMQVSSLGILTNGTDWKVAKYDHERKRLFKSETSPNPLQGLKASGAHRQR